jgi:hypothetical protein
MPLMRMRTLQPQNVGSPMSQLIGEAVRGRRGVRYGGRRSRNEGLFRVLSTQHPAPSPHQVGILTLHGVLQITDKPHCTRLSDESPCE